MNGAGVIYFIQTGREGPIKIGWASSPEHAGRRLTALQIGSAARLVLIGLRAGSTADEAALHERFAEDRIGGEWFWPSAALLEEVGVGLDWPREWEEVLHQWAKDEGRSPAAVLLDAFMHYLGHPEEDWGLLRSGSEEAMEHWADVHEARAARGGQPQMRKPAGRHSA